MAAPLPHGAEAPLGAKVEPRESRIEGAGTGLFAADTLAAGEVVAEYTGRILTLAQAKALRDRTYLKAVTLNRHIDAGGAEGSVAKFINDHFDASLHNVRFEKRGDRIVVVAKREIVPGEELFIDYGRGHWLFVGSAQFLGLEVFDEGGEQSLRAMRQLAAHEVVCCLESPAMADVDKLSTKVRFAADGEEANCRLKPSPFVSGTIMVTATREIAAGEPIRVRSLDRVAVRPSGIAGAGLGLFSRVSLPSDTLVGVYSGSVSSAADLDAKAAKSSSVRGYALALPSTHETEQRFLDPTDGRGQARAFTAPNVCFVNHGNADANCRFVRAEDDPLHVELRTRRAIEAGEELLACYDGFLPVDFVQPEE